MKIFLHEDLEKSLIVELEVSIKTTPWAPELAQSHTDRQTDIHPDQTGCTYRLTTGKEATSSCQQVLTGKQ